MSVSRVATATVVAGVVAMAGLLVVQVVLPQTSGTFALLQILAPYLAVLAVGLAALVALAARSSVSIASLGLIVLVVGARFGDEWISVPGSPEGATHELQAMTWNLETGPDRAADLLEPLLGMDRDVVALQELTPRVADAIENDSRVTQRYPYRVLIPHPSVRGLGLLSAHPIILDEGRATPLALHARLDIQGSPLDVVVAHPMPGDIRTGPLRLPIGFDARERDGRLQELRAWVDEIRAGSTVPLVLIGDLNVTPTEPGYDLIARGFVDAHRTVGLGPGLTWRPGEFERLGLGVLRIDYVLTAGPIQPISTRTICAVASDHCIVDATLDIRDATGPAG
jgi:endonuclease/exonuclease/phosphatase family metal-dependent hydrolase